MKIAIISNSLRLTHGWGNITYELANAFCKKGHEVSVFVPSDFSPSDLAPTQFKICSCLPLTPIDLKSFKNLKLLNTDLKKFKSFDLVHILDGFSYSLLGIAIKQLLRIPYTQGTQGTYGMVPFSHPISKFLWSKILRHSSVLIAPSRFTGNFIQSSLAKKGDRPQLKVIHNGINFSRFSQFNQANDVDERWNHPQKSFIGIGEIKKRKGLDIVIKAMSILLKKKSDIVYKIVGPGDTTELLALTQKLGLEKNIKFLGPLLNQEIVRELHQSFAYTHAPRSEGNNVEGFGIVYVEANAAGLPCIGTKSGGVPEAIQDGKTGILVAEENPEELADAMLKLIEDRELYFKLSRDAITWASEHDWDTIASEYLQEFDRVTSRTKHGPNSLRSP